MALIKQLKSFLNKTSIYPKTVTKAVYDDDGNRLDNVLEQFGLDINALPKTSELSDMAFKNKNYPTSTDLNNFTHNAIEVFNENTANRPCPYGMCVSYGEDFKFQLAFPTNADYIYIRRNINYGTWTEWKKIGRNTNQDLHIGTDAAFQDVFNVVNMENSCYYNDDEIVIDFSVILPTKKDIQYFDSHMSIPIYPSKPIHGQIVSWGGGSATFVIYENGNCNIQGINHLESGYCMFNGIGRR